VGLWAYIMFVNRESKFQPWFHRQNLYTRTGPESLTPVSLVGYYHQPNGISFRQTALTGRRNVVYRQTALK